MAIITENKIGYIDVPSGQPIYKEVTVDTTTTSTAFVDLLTQVITTGANFIIIRCTWGESNTNDSDNYFQITVDGVAIQGAGERTQGGGARSGSGSLQKKVSVTAGSHTVKVQWRVSNGTGRIRPVTVPEEHCSLLIEEVTS